MTVKDTKDILYLAKVIVLNILREVLKDGFQPSDLLAFVKSAEFATAVQVAYDGIENVPGELEKIGLMDGIELARYGYGFWSDIVQELKSRGTKAA